MPVPTPIPPTTRVLIWNAERKSPRGPTGSRIPAVLARLAPDIVLLTEGETGLMPPGGHTIAGRPLPDAHMGPAERRVLAWSREPWTEVEDYAHFEPLRLTDPADPEAHEPPAARLPGRIVSATTVTALGPIRVHAVCIPWHFSRVQWNAVKRRPWQDHLAFLDAFAPVLARTPPDVPTIVGGDYNQRVPRGAGYPFAPAERLAAALAPPWTIVTAGALAPTSADPADPAPAPLIDHLAVNAVLRATSVEGFGRHDHDGKRLSDHTGCVVTVAR